MNSNNWEDYPSLGNANVPYNGVEPKKEQPKEEGSFLGNIARNLFNPSGQKKEETAKPEPVESDNWEDYPSIGNANAPPEEQEGKFKQAIRTGAQIPLGVLNATPIPVAADAMAMWGWAEAMQGLEELKEQGIPVDEQKYMQAVQDAMGMFPNQRNFEKLAEHYTGIPLEPKNFDQEALRFGSGIMGAAGLFNAVGSGIRQGASLRPPKLIRGQRGSTVPGTPGTPPPPPGVPPVAPPQIGPNLIGTGERQSYTDAENALNYIKGLEQANSPNAAPQPPMAQTAQRVPIPQAGPRPVAADLRARRMEPTDAIGIELDIQRPPPRNATPRERVEGLFPARVTDPTDAGNALIRNISARADETRAVHTHLYRQAEELTPYIAEPRYDVMIDFNRRIEALNTIHPSVSQKQLINEMQGVIDKMSLRNEAGEFLLDAQGQRVLEPWTNEQVLDQIKAFRQNVDSNFLPGNPGNEYLPLIQELSTSAAVAAELANAPEAAQAIRAADNSYRRWSQTYNNSTIKNIRDPENMFPNRTFNSLQDPDHFNIAREILQESNEGRALLTGLQRKIVNDKLKPFYGDKKFTAVELDDALLELQSVISPQQAQTIRQDLMHRPARMPQRGQQLQRPEQVERAVSKYLGMDPEDLRRGMNNVTDMRRIRERTAGTQHFEHLVEHKTKDIVYKGNLELEPSGEELFNTLNKAKNAELLTEMHGEATYRQLLNGAREARDAEAAALEAERAAGRAARTTAEQEAIARQVRKDKFKKYKTAAKIMAYVGLL